MQLSRFLTVAVKYFQFIVRGKNILEIVLYHIEQHCEKDGADF